MNFDGADVYVDAVGAVQFNGSVVKIDFLTLYPDPKNQKALQPRLAGRLALPVSAVVQLSDSINKLIEELKTAQKNAGVSDKSVKP